MPPFVMVSQEGGDFSEFPDLPPAQAPSEFANVGEAEDGAHRGRDGAAARSGSTPCSPR